MKKVYLAGPGIFRLDARAYGESLKALCLAYGFEGLFPLDNEVEGDHGCALADRIRASNLAMLACCDYVVADLSPFRGPEPDSGTVWEIGYAAALGKPVLGYSSDRREQRAKTVDILGLQANATTDREGQRIEDFGLSHNLMFAHVVGHDSVEACLQALRAWQAGVAAPA